MHGPLSDDTRGAGGARLAPGAARAGLAGRLLALRAAIAALLALAILFPPVAQAAFDHSHAQWDALVKRHVRFLPDGYASQTDYRGFQAERPALQRYLASLSAVPRNEYEGWSKPQQLAFLINAYNAFTVELVLTRYPDLKSIRDLGSFLRSPWKLKFFSLLGEKRHLDELEHELIRAPGVFDEPRIHMAVNCASVGCPALRDEAFVAARLDAQLEDGVVRFLSDRSRNRAGARALEVSKIFDWYGDDFAKRSGSVARWLAPYASRLADDRAVQQAVQQAALPVRFLDYDWALNDLQR
jgi:hypothetical protein